MSNFQFCQQNEQLVARAQNTITEEFFHKFATLHCKISDSQLAALQSKNLGSRIQIAIVESGRIWTVDELTHTLNCIDELKAAGLSNCCDHALCEIKC